MDSVKPTLLKVQAAGKSINKAEECPIDGERSNSPYHLQYPPLRLSHHQKCQIPTHPGKLVRERTVAVPEKAPYPAQDSGSLLAWAPGDSPHSQTRLFYWLEGSPKSQQK